jgi:hypothetical protein
MPYVDPEGIRPDEVTPEPIAAGLWVPEFDWEGWKRRGVGLAHRDMWDRDRDVARDELEQLTKLSDDSRDLYLKVLGQDLGSVQRDTLFYSNWLEQLKQSPNDTTADAVFEAMKQLHFTSADWEGKPGGPPRGQSPRPFRATLNWLLGLLAKVGKILLKIADALVAMLSKEGPSLSVSIGAFPPSFGVDVSTTLFNTSRLWDCLHRFLENAQAELARAI